MQTPFVQMQTSMPNPNLVSKLSPPKKSPHTYISLCRGYGHLPGAMKTLKTLKLSRQNSRHFRAVDSELALWETSKHVS